MKKWISLVLVAVMLCAMFPFFIQEGHAANATDYVKNTTIQSRLAAVFKAYEPGKAFFTKNGKACSCHTNNSFSCATATHQSCNCLRYPTINGKTVDLLASQCLGYARYYQEVLFGYNEKADTSKFTKLSGVSSLDASKTKNWFTTNKAKLHVGTHIRVYGSGHSISLLKVDYEKGVVYYAECNWTSQSTNNGEWCRVNSIQSSTWSKFASKYGSIDYAYVYTNYYTEYPETVTPILTVTYDANGGSIPAVGYKYKVTEEIGLNMRTGAGTSYAKVTALTQNTTFNVNLSEVKTADGYTWGKTTVGDYTGWVVISDYVSKIGNVYPKNYYLNGSSVYKVSTGAKHTHPMTYGENVPDGFYNAYTLGLSRDGYTFVGWSLSKDGGTIYDENQSFYPEEIVPDLKNGSKTVTAYAIWQENHSYNAVVTAPTCTEAGYTTYTCACGDTYTEAGEAALGHGEYTYTNNGENHTIACGKCDYTAIEAHTYVDGTCICGAEEEPACEYVDENADAKCDTCGELNLDANMAFYGNGFQLGADIRGIFQVRHMKNTSTYAIDSYKVIVNKGGVESELELVATSDKTNYVTYGYAITMAAKEMTDVVELRIVATNSDGSVYSSEPITWTVQEALFNLLDTYASVTTEAGENTKRLIVSMLTYGAEAQKYFEYNDAAEQLATYGMDPAFEKYILTETPAMESIPKADETGATYKLKGVGFNLSARIEVLAQFTVGKSDSKEIYSAEVVQTHTAPDGTVTTKTYTIDGADCLKSGSTFAVYFKDFSSNELRDTLAVTLYKNGVQVSATQTISAESALVTIQTAQPELVKAIMNYGDCARAVFG